MKIFFFTLGISLLLTLNSNAQNNIGIGTVTPNSKAVLELVATDKGFLTPRVTDVEMTAISASGIVPNGLLVYNTTKECFHYWKSSTSVWKDMCSGGGLGNGKDTIVIVHVDTLVANIIITDSLFAHFIKTDSLFSHFIYADSLYATLIRADSIFAGYIKADTVSAHYGSFDSLYVGGQNILTTISDSINAKAWLLKGNLGTNATTHFLGTKDNTDLVFRTNNVEKMRVTSAGFVGIGTNVPIVQLHSSAGILGNGIVYSQLATGGGYAALMGGGASNSGYLQLYKGNGITRLGYIGLDNTDITYAAEGGARHVFSRNASGNVAACCGSRTVEIAEDFSSGRFASIGFHNSGESEAKIELHEILPTGLGLPARRLLIATDQANTTGLQLTGGLFYGNADSRTETRIDAGLQGNAGAQSGFYETSTPTNYPTGATSWWHLIDTRHSSTTTNYAMQIAGSFFDQDLWYRKTNNSATTPWHKLLAVDATNNSPAWLTTGNVGTTGAANWIGTNDVNDFVIKTNATQRMRADANGHVYINATGSSANDVFSVRANNAASTVNNAIGVIAISGRANGGVGVVGVDVGAGDGMEGISTGGDGVYGETAGGLSGGVTGLNTNVGGTGVLGRGDWTVGDSWLVPTTGAGGSFNGDDMGVTGYANNSASGLGAGTTSAGGYFRDSISIFSKTYAWVAAYNSGTKYKILGDGVVSTIVKDKQNKEHIMYCTESPEVLLDDYGQGQLINGVAIIKLDEIYTHTILVNDKHSLRVFVQLEGDCKGVFVTEKTSQGFTVKELDNGKSNVSFTYRVVANRKDEVINGQMASKYQDLRFPLAEGLNVPTIDISKRMVEKNKLKPQFEKK